MGALTTDLADGQTVELLTADRANLRAISGGAGGGAPTLIKVDMTDDRDFDGQGTAPFTTKLSPVTILQNLAPFSGLVTWGFGNAGVSPGWVVYLAVDTDALSSAGSVNLSAQDVGILGTLSETTCPRDDTDRPFLTPAALFFDGVIWRFLGNALSHNT